MTDRFLSPTGVNSGAGGTGAPWQTLAYALSHLALNDRLLIRNGTYARTGFMGGPGVNAAAGGCTIEPDTGQTAVLIQGVAGQRVFDMENWANLHINGNANGGQITIDGGGSPGPPNSTGTPYNYAAWSGIFIYYQPSPGSPGTPQIPDGCIIENLIVQNVNGYGIQFGHVAGDSTVITTGCSNNIVRHNDVSRCGVGIRFRKCGLGNEIWDNDIHDLDRIISYGFGVDNGAVAVELHTIQPTGGSKAAPSVWAHGNRIWNCTWYSVMFNGRDGGCFEFFGNAYCLIEDNDCWDSEIFIETGTSSRTNFKMKENVVRYNRVYGTFGYNGVGPAAFIRGGEDNDWVHNTFDIDSADHVIRIVENPGDQFGGDFLNFKFKNNIVITRTAGGSNNRAIFATSEAPNIYPVAAGFDMDNNLVWNTQGSSQQLVSHRTVAYTGTQLATWQAATPFSDFDKWAQDPLFVNQPARDYHLSGASPAINAGEILAGYSYTGAAPDIGAYEYGAPVSPLLASDDFSTNQTDTLGTADVGGTWALIGTPANIDVAGGYATFQHATANVAHGGLLANAVEDLYVKARFQCSVAPVGGAAILQLIVRASPYPTSYIRYNLKLNAGGTVTGQFQKILTTGTTTLSDVTASGTHTMPNAAEWWWARVEINQSSPTQAQARARIWKDGTSEPSTWLQTLDLDSSVTAADAELLDPGNFGFRTLMSTGVTSLPAELRVDDFEADDLSAPAPIPLVMTSAGVTTETFTITTSIPLVMTSVGVGATTAVLTTSIPLVMASAGTSTTSAALSGALAAQLVMTSAGSSSTFANLTSGGEDLAIGIEVILYNATRTTVLALLDGARQAQWYDPLNETGTGRFIIARNDPKADLIYRGQIVTFRLHGIDRYSIVIDSRDLTTGSPNGPSGEFWDVKGKGVESLFDKARQAPGTNDYGTKAAGGVFYTAWLAALARGTLSSAISVDFGLNQDSSISGAFWNDSAAYTVDTGTPYTELLRLMTAVGIEVTMTPDLHLKAYRDGLGTDRTLTVVFREGAHTRDEVQIPEQGTQRFTRCWVEGKSGSVYLVLGNESDPNVGVREGYFKVTTTDEPTALQAIGLTAISASALAAQAIKLPLLHGFDQGQFEPYLDYGKGDRVQLDVDGVADGNVRIVALTIAGQDDGTYTVDADLNAITYEAITRLKRDLDRLPPALRRTA